MSNQKKINNYANNKVDGYHSANTELIGKKKHRTKKEINYTIRWTFIGILICLFLYGIMFLAVNGFPQFRVALKENKLNSFVNHFTGRQNILILGIDSNGRQTEPFNGTRSDTNIIISIDKFGKSVNAISIPRDSKVYIAEGHGIDKINAAHAIGGPRLTIKTIENTFGIHIDHYIAINYAGVKDFVKVLGGVGINVEKRMRYTDRAGGLYIDLYPGYQILNAQQAEGYLRFRHDAIGDIGRMKRQQWFVRGIVERLQAPDAIVKVPALVQAINKNIRTDMNPIQLADFAAFAKKIDLENIQTATLPGKPSSRGYISYWILDPAKTQEIIDRLIYREEPPVPVNGGYSVTLLYNSKFREQIPVIEEVLAKEGFKVESVSVSRNPHAQIIAHSSNAGYASVSKIKTIIPALKKAQFVLDPGEFSGTTDYTIVLSD